MRRTLQSLLVVAVALFAVGFSTTNTYAWAWSKQTSVVAYANYNAITFFTGFRCGTATLTVNGSSKTVQTTKEWFKNTCKAVFTGIPVKNTVSVNFQASVNYGGGWTPIKGQTSAYIDKPLGPETMIIKQDAVLR